MSGEILVGERREIRRVEDEVFVKALEKLPERMTERLRFMTREHHAVRDFVVRELPRQRGPVSARQIASVTGIERQRVAAILAELEKHLFFLVRNVEGEVSWAFPVTVEKTEHRLTFSSGEKIFGA